MMHVNFITRRLMGTITGLCLASATVALAIEPPATGLIDPTQPPTEILSRMPQAAEQSELVPVLSAVKSNGKHSFAIINNTLLRLGDSIQGNRLVAVSANTATLLNRTQQKTVLRVGVVDYRKPVHPNLPPKKPAKRKRVMSSPSIPQDAQ